MCHSKLFVLLPSRKIHMISLSIFHPCLTHFPAEISAQTEHHHKEGKNGKIMLPSEILENGDTQREIVIEFSEQGT